MIKSVSAIAFDFDGTLVNSNGLKRKAFFQVLEGILSETELDKLIRENTHLDRHGIVEFAVKAGSRTDLNIEELVVQYTKLVHDQVVAADLMPGVDRVEGELWSHYPCAVISATPDSALEDILQEKRWLQHFDYVVGSGVEKHRALKIFSEKVAVPLDRILMVGDQKNDQEAAAAAGTQFYAVGDVAVHDGGLNLLVELMEKQESV